MMTRLVYACFSGLILFACNNAGNKTTANAADSTQQSGTVVNQVSTGDNSYIINPPDTSYTGDYVDKYENGNTKFKGVFRFGKRHGQWMAWYANGILWSECFYDKGLKHGANNVYYENGKPRYKGFFKNDLKDSVWLYFDENGMQVKEVVFKNDEPISEK